MRRSHTGSWCWLANQSRSTSRSLMPKNRMASSARPMITTPMTTPTTFRRLDAGHEGMDLGPCAMSVSVLVPAGCQRAHGARPNHKHGRAARNPSSAAVNTVGRTRAPRAHLEAATLARPGWIDHPGPSEAPVSLLDELAASWPPAEDPPDSGYLRTSLAAALPLAATALRPHGERGLAVVVARDASGRLMLAPLVREGAGWRRARPRDGASAALVEALAAGQALDDGFGCGGWARSATRAANAPSAWTRPTNRWSWAARWWSNGWPSPPCGRRACPTCRHTWPPWAIPVCPRPLGSLVVGRSGRARRRPSRS